MKFWEYYKEWVQTYKNGAVRPVTLNKYIQDTKHIEALEPELEISDLNRVTYQRLINKFAEHHEKQTVMDFHHHLKSCILDALDEGLVERNPTRKVVIKGKPPRKKKIKFLSQSESQKLMEDLDLGAEVNYDWLILLILKTGLRFSEALGLTPDDFDFQNRTININKTWDYKGIEGGGFAPTKNQSSIRKVTFDWEIAFQFQQLIKDLPRDKPIFVIKDKIYNSTVNVILERHCKNMKITVITVHGLRHTHASLLLYNGVSIASVAKRLGHADMTTTQKTYLHIVQELENKDKNLIMSAMAGLSC